MLAVVIPSILRSQNHTKLKPEEKILIQGSLWSAQQWDEKAFKGN